MILTAHQPVYLPWLGLFHKIALADMFISFNQVQYQPKDWNNRNKINTAQGPVWVSVPVLRSGFLERKYTEIEINNSINWGRKHFNSLQGSYAKTPYFKRYADFFEDTYNKEWNTLVELNEYMLCWFLDILGINVPVRRADEWTFLGIKSDMVLDMCLQVGADNYIFGAEGRNYADEQSFNEAGVGVQYQDYHHPEYPQLHGDFVSHLSIIDLLFNCGDNSLEILMSGNLDRAALARHKIKGSPP